MPQPQSIPATGTPGKPISVPTNLAPKPAPITYEAPPVSKFGAQPTIDLTKERDRAGQATQAEVDQYYKQNNADEYNKISEVNDEDRMAVTKLPGYSSMGIGQIQEAERQLAKQRADKWVANNSKAVTSKDGTFKTDMDKPMNMPEMHNPTVNDRGFVREKDIDIEQRKGPKQPVATAVAKTPEQKKKEDWQSALGNLFDGNNIGNFASGLGAAISAAYGNRSLNDSAWGRRRAEEAQRAAELEKLGKAQEYEAANREDQQAATRELAAMDIAARRDIAGANKENEKVNDVAKVLLGKFQTGQPITKEQIKYLTEIYKVDPMVLKTLSLGGTNTPPIDLNN